SADPWNQRVPYHTPRQGVVGLPNQPGVAKDFRLGITDKHGSLFICVHLWFHFVQFMILSFAFILLVSLSGLPQSQVSDSVYDRAATAFQDGKLGEPEETLRSNVRSRPDDARALGMLGVVLDAQKRFDEAERYYVQDLRLAPGAAAVHHNMGNHYLAKGLH